MRKEDEIVKHYISNLFTRVQLLGWVNFLDLKKN